MFRATHNRFFYDLLLITIVIVLQERLVFCIKIVPEVEQSTSVESVKLTEAISLDFTNGSDVSINFNLSKYHDEFEGRGKDKKLLQRILPLFILPFLIQSAIIPMFLSTLKMMLIKSMMVGKLALILIAINAIRTSNAFKNRGEERLADIHYGYHGSGMEEYGAYVNGRRF